MSGPLLRKVTGPACDSQHSKMSTRLGSTRSLADRDVEAANCPASVFDDAHTAGKVGLSLLRLNGDVSCNDDHVCAPVLSPSCPARRAVPLRSR